MADEIKRVEQVVAAAGDALVQDVIATVRAHPQYAGIVNQLTEHAVQALLAAL